ncbi:LacI family transcriptional regulator [Heyndrickxia sporothermodurans]|uniref:LacI family DNA-binding transcriptional regulator n=1 Tax=Heyndrickxia sporothermodurans TaxID=46224 RepID=UPI000D3D2345|nr:LacI family DNA-binding transcriptional regulator [Heyndrickxia sporothermodurans]PTY78978.1 LacI family transcriptional regulator [Heyndrickxia sporothermodurans]
MATIADVAKLAGLSRATVSRVINNHPYVSDEKKKLVKEAMEALHYYPNSTAQKLRSQKTETIAVLVPILTNPFFAYLLEGIDTVANERGYHLLVCQTRYSQEKEIYFLNLLKTKQVDGIILTSIENDWNKIEDFSEFGPIVLCNEFDERANVPTVRLDQVYGGYIGTRHLIEKGHTKIAYCKGKYGKHFSKLTMERELGYKMALAEYDIPIREDFIFREVTDIEGGKITLRKMLSLKDRPTAIFTGSDMVAAGVITEAKASGLRIPEDIAVIGFDDQPIAEMIEPKITTIKQPILEIGQKASKLMMDIIEKKDGQDEFDSLLSLQLIVRAST